MPSRLPALATAAVAVVAMLLALAWAPGTAETTMPSMPATGPPGVLASVVLTSAGPRPARTFALRSLDDRVDVGRAEVDWEPHGDGVCAAASVPLGADGTEVRIRVDTDLPFSGHIEGSLYTPHEACERAVGTWRGMDGDYEGRDGGLVVALAADGSVRMVLSP